MFCVFFLSLVSAASSPPAPSSSFQFSQSSATTAAPTQPPPVPITRPAVQIQQNFAIVNIIEKCNISATDTIYTHIDGTRYVVIRSLSKVSERVFEQKTDVMCLPGNVYDFTVKNDPYAMLDCYACMKEDVEKIGAAMVSSKAETAFEIVGFALGIVGMVFTAISAIFTIYRHFKKRPGTRSTVPRNSPKADDQSDLDSVEEVAT